MNLGFGEMVFLFILGLLLFGPKKLPEIGRQLGKAMLEFKRASNEFQAQLNEEVRQLEADIEKEKSSIEQTITAPASVRPDFTTARNETLQLEADSGQHEGAAPEVSAPEDQTKPSPLQAKESNV